MIKTHATLLTTAPITMNTAKVYNMTPIASKSVCMKYKSTHPSNTLTTTKTNSLHE